MQAYAKGLSPIGRHPRVTLRHPSLQLDGRADRLDSAAEFDHHAVTHRFHDTAVKTLDHGRHQFGQMRTEVDECAFLVGTHHAAVADDIGEQDRRESTVGGIGRHRRARQRAAFSRAA